MSENKQNPKSPSAKMSILPEYLALFCAVLAFSPVLYWLWESLILSQQLRDALIILAVAILFFAIDRRIKFHLLVFSQKSLLWLVAAYALLIVSKYIGMWGAVSVFAGLSCAITALGLACTDKSRYAYAVGGAFFSFTILSLFIKIFDLPLRVLAGKSAAMILSLFNKTVQVLAFSVESPQIALKVDGKPYLVATECNGFGIISSCIVLSVAFALFRKNISCWSRGLLIAVCAALGFFANTLRIVSITSIAPLAGEKNYLFIHEFFGYLFFSIALFLVWFIASKAFLNSAKS